MQAVAEASDECRDIMSSNGGVGIEVLAQVHRDADARGDTALASAATHTLAVLTHRCDPLKLKYVCKAPSCSCLQPESST